LILSVTLADDKDLIYEGIATRGRPPLSRRPSYAPDDKDLIYEGIATSALPTIRILAFDDKDLIYEGIATELFRGICCPAGAMTTKT